VRDITERKQIDKTLQDSEYRLIKAQEISKSGHYIFNFKAEAWTCSKELDEILGLDDNFKKNVFGWLQVVHPDDKRMMLKCLQDDILTQHLNFDKEYKIINLKTGQERWVHGLGKLKCDSRGQLFEMFGTIQDITERKQSDALVNKLSQAIEQAGESILITDREGIIEYVNPGFEKITGYSAEEAIGQTPSMLKSGNQDTAFYTTMWKIITTGRVWRGKIINKNKDGSLYPVILTISPIFNASHDISNFVCIQSDPSKHEDMKQCFFQSQKMEAIGTLTGGIAHDFNNILAGMNGNVYLAKQRTQEMPQVLQNLANIEQLSFRAAEMIQQLLIFARKSMISMESLSLTPFIKDTLKTICPSVPENIHISRDICRDILIINADRAQLHLVLMHLMNNARDALDVVDEPCINIRLESLHTDAVFIESHPYFKDGLYAHLSVEDNGCGIPEDQIEHLFEPFFTTKEQGKGTGLGLSLVYGAIKTHQGFVEVDSIEGKGSTFHIYLPLLETEYVAPEATEKQESTGGHGELILVADDEPMVRETMAEVLESMGYKVLQAKDGLEAIELFQAHEQEIALALLDVIMPNLGGVQLAEKIRTLSPDLPVIFLTGHNKEYVLDGDKQIQNCKILSKPVKFDFLSRTMRQMLTQMLD